MPNNCQSTVIKMNSCQRKLNKESRRAKTIDYYLKEKRVCKKFFLATLNISDGRITAWKKKQESEEPYTDKRGRHSNHRICDPDVVAKINAHIQSFPVMESHYARANTHKLYLAANLSINEMYRLFVKKYGKICLPYKYRKEFCTNYNYSFHRPKKDGCVTCERYKLAEDKGPLEAGYTQHNQNRELAKALKKADKDSAKQDSSTKVYTFDMQAVLTTPCSTVSPMYYSRKFATYNCTFYDLVTKEGFCFLWNETEGQRGSDEVGTSMFTKISELPTSVKNVIMFCDCCGGQNRNRFIANLLVYMNRNLQLDSIEIKFLESGHTQMEVDSMHSAIEGAKRNIPVFSPDEWPTIIASARRDEPYDVRVFTFEDMIDLKDLHKQSGHAMKKNDANEQVNWLKIKVLRVEKEQKDSLLYKEQYQGEFCTMDITRTVGRRRTAKVGALVLKKKFKERLKISTAKLKDLQNLCKEGVIPKRAHGFYNGLKSTNMRDCLDEPDLWEEDDIEDCE